MKQTKFALILNDKIFVIFLCLQAKFQLFQDDKALLLCASNWEIFRRLFNLE